MINSIALILSKTGKKRIDREPIMANHGILKI
jgi:hypothetical protein